MPKCALYGCCNSTDKGVKVSNFPKDPKRRQQWIANCISLGGMRSDFSPGKKSVLCEYHFAAEMWENPRVDGKKKLKYSAVPTIFGELVYQVEKKQCNESVKVDNINIKQVIVNIDHLKKNIEILPLPNADSTSDSNTCTNICESQKSLLKTVLHDTTNQTNQISSNLINQEHSQVNQESTMLAPDEMHRFEEGEQSNDNLSVNIEELSDYSDEELMEKERDLLCLRKEYEATLKSDIFKKYEMAVKLFEKSEKLRIVMKKKHKQKHQALKMKIRKLEKEKIQKQSRSIHNNNPSCKLDRKS